MRLAIRFSCSRSPLAATTRWPLHPSPPALNPSPCLQLEQCLSTLLIWIVGCFNASTKGWLVALAGRVDGDQAERGVPGAGEVWNWRNRLASRGFRFMPFTVI